MIGPTVGSVGQVLTFSDAGSNDPDGDSLGYAWTFGDGASGNGPSVTHAYTAATTHTVSLTVSDGRGGSDSDSLTVTISPSPNQPPIAVMLGPTAGTVGEPLTFSATGSSDPDGDNLSYAWTFGDGASDSGPSVTHAYPAATTYTVSLIVSDGRGGTDSAALTVTISPLPNQPPIAVVNGPYVGVVSQALAFTASGSNDAEGGPLTYSWNFGDGASGSGSTPMHTYSSADTYDVTLTVTDPAGATASASTTATISAAAPTIGVQPIVSGLSNPLFLTAPASDSRLFIVEKPGRIRIVENGSLLQAPFLDLAGQVSTGFEQGLLGLVFHPSYASNGFFYVYYTAPNGDIRVERYTRSGANPNLANAASAHLIITVPHSSETNHNGGMLAFGTDGKLYIGTGDGGGGGEPDGNGQNRDVLLGKLLRIDVDGGDPYAIPLDNPFVGRAGRDEIWALGLRNPWRWAFDRVAGLLYVADVGQGAWEEVNVVPAATGSLNYGWDVMEGLHCHEPLSGCNQTGLTLPVLEYGHTGGACSITGGFVYRGAAIPSLQGTYFYADYCAGWVRSFRYANGAATDQKDWDFGDLDNILSFGEDAAGELYILSSNGTVYRIAESP